MWLPRPIGVLKLSNVWEYEEMATQIEHIVQQLLEKHNYNTVGNFLTLYESFKESGTCSLQEFFQSYTPQITSRHHTCVGLALELWAQLFQLNNRFRCLTDYLYLVSCEENIETYGEYESMSDKIEAAAQYVEKEHVLLALQFEVAGRNGVLLCDPGYHIGRVVTIMHDQLYPHTGWFVQSKDSPAEKKYSYNFSTINNNFIEWTDITTNANGIQTKYVALIYYKRHYLTAVDVTERRNLVYNFRSLLSRDPKGHLKAGIYFRIKENHDDFTIFYNDRGTKKKLKLNFASFLHSNKIEESTLKIISECSIQLNLLEKGLLTILTSLAKVFADQNFIKQLLQINTAINTMTEE